MTIVTMAPRSPLPESPPGSPPTVRLWAVTLAGLSALLLTLVAAGWPPLTDWDASVAARAHEAALAHPGTTRTNRVFSDWVWDPWTMRALAAVTVLWLWRRGTVRLAVTVGVACLGAAAAQQLLKAAVGRERPEWPDPVDTAHFAAYPSGHAMTATVVCGLVVWGLHRVKAARPVLVAAWTVAVVSVAGVGLTRVWLGVHWPTDVLGGWLLGGLTVALAALAYRRVETADRRQ
ncbi:phosphatase PAP2 family protein [Streptomyces sp. FR-008]|uniref:phosphatase PAP2 family protein n=1 Tax=Streptomyces sp. FR-008 TaxID=206662 RepID=UPI00071F2831|nr:phosphatase PAP2 family protein [Streptomyces sp. FR-008]ALM36992.1 membrane protein [Streptomyces sp. FR-008]KAF0791516.1 membrane protein [Streptomyces sp. FR-008]